MDGLYDTPKLNAEGYCRQCGTPLGISGQCAFCAVKEFTAIDPKREDAPFRTDNLPTPVALRRENDEYFFVGFYLRVARFHEYLKSGSDDAAVEGRKVFPQHAELEAKLNDWLESAQPYLPAWYVTYRIGKQIR